MKRNLTCDCHSIPSRDATGCNDPSKNSRIKQTAVPSSLKKQVPSSLQQGTRKPTRPIGSAPQLPEPYPPYEPPAPPLGIPPFQAPSDFGYPQNQGGDPPAPQPLPPFTSPKDLTFDPEQFRFNLTARMLALGFDLLGPTLEGRFPWAFVINHNGKIYKDSHGAARMGSEVGGWVDLQTTTRMTIASMTKMITATLLIRLLQVFNRLDVLDSPITDFVPPHWHKEKLKNTTVRMLIQHKSGFTTGQSAHTWQLIKQRFVEGNASIPNQSYIYCNFNYSVLRYVCAAVVKGPKNLYTTDNDEAINKVVSQTYIDCANQLVLGPSGISFAYCKETGSKPTLCYNDIGAKMVPDARKGVPDFDLSLEPGAWGFRLSAEDYDLFLTALIKGYIVKPPELDKMWMRGHGKSDDLDSWYDIISGKYGTYYMHGGDARPGEGCGIKCAPEGVHHRFMVYRDWGVKAVLMTNMIYYPIDFRQILIETFEASFS